MAQIIQLKRGTTAEWEVSEVVLAEGELGLELLSVGPPRFKFGDGVRRWIDLVYPCLWPSTSLVPQNTALPTITGVANEGSTLTVSNGVWTDSPDSYAIQWLRAGSVIAGATASTYLVALADVGSTISVRVTATNASGASAPANSSSTAAVSSTATAPGAVTNVTAGTAASNSQPLTWVAPSTGSAPMTYTVGYRLGNSSGAYTTAATGISGTSYTVNGLSPSTQYDYSVIATNAYGSGAAGLLNDAATAAFVADTRPRYGIGAATAGDTTPAALLASMSVMSGGTNGGKAGTFTVAPGAGQYGWTAFEQAASASGVTFTDSLGSGGWQGAGFPGNNGSDSGASPNTSTITYDDGTTTWRFFRQSYAAAGSTFTSS